MSIHGTLFFFSAALCGFWNLVLPPGTELQVLGSDNMDGDLTTGLPKVEFPSRTQRYSSPGETQKESKQKSLQRAPYPCLPLGI